jgi:8-oxo-dGTP pyrophosphatase MutT (NUDIX family)
MHDDATLNNDMGKSKHVTCGVIVTDGDRMLICHPTNGSKWDIPKGKADPGEDHAYAASRELSEETGMVVLPDRLVRLGTHAYKQNKDLSLFLYRTDSMPNVDDLFCESRFDDNGVMTAEMDEFALIPIGDIREWLNDDMARVLETVLHA